MQYFSSDYRDELVKSKKSLYLILALFFVGIGSCSFNPEGRGWIAIAAAIVALTRYTISGGREHIKNGEGVSLEDEAFKHHIMETGYHVTIPYEEIESVRLCTLPPNSIKLSLSGNRVQVLKDFPNVRELAKELENRAGI